jgi:hypothetical protein
MMRLKISWVTVSVAALALFAVMVWRPGVMGLVVAGKNPFPATPREPDQGSTPVLVELFTSEGCSSCPPADELLSLLGQSQPVRGANVIALEEHVDYWDQQGWKDPFSSEAATTRQGEYGVAFGGEQIYTPQMVVDGRAEFVGSSDIDALRAIHNASQRPKTAIQLSWQKEDSLSMHIGVLPGRLAGESAQLFLAVAENMLHSDVKHGENAGRALEHNGVVRKLLPLGKVDAGPAGFSSTVAVHPDRDWNRANLRAVVFVQERRSRHILAAAAIAFPKI